MFLSVTGNPTRMTNNSKSYNFIVFELTRVDNIVVNNDAVCMVQLLNDYLCRGRMTVTCSVPISRHNTMDGAIAIYWFTAMYCSLWFLIQFNISHYGSIMWTMILSANPRVPSKSQQCSANQWFYQYMSPNESYVLIVRSDKLSELFMLSELITAFLFLFLIYWNTSTG